MQLYIVPAFLFMLFGATRIHGVSADEPTPFVCDPNFTKFQLILKTDWFGDTTSWILKHTDDGTILDRSVEGGYGVSITYVFPSADEYYCLQDGECYTFTIEDDHCDGICCGWDEGYYQGVLDGVLKFEGAEFGCSESKELCVPSSDTTTPTASPTATTNPPSYLPSGMYPSSHPCTNSKGKVQLNKKKTTTCAKLEKGSSKKKKKYCKIPDVFQACPDVCNIKCTCTDEKTFKLKGKKKKKYKCKNVGKKGQPKCSGTVDKKNDILVEDVCPKTCDVCF